MNIKTYFKNKSIGLIFSVLICCLSLITAIVYATCYAGSTSMSWFAFILLLVGCVLGVVLFFFKKNKWIPYVQAICNFIALLFYIYGIYFYVSVVVVGIDLQSVDAAFVFNTVLFGLTFILSVANIYLKQDNTD